MGKFLEVFDNAIRECPSPTVPSGGENKTARDAQSDESTKAPGVPMAVIGDVANAFPPPAPVTPDSRHPLITSAVRAKLEAIEPEARRLGWPAELLWNQNFWDAPRGLAAVLEPADEIAEVGPDCITILKHRRDVLRFRRHVG